MIQFNGLGWRKENLPQRRRCKCLRKWTKAARSSRDPERAGGGHHSNRGQAKLGATGPGIAIFQGKTEVLLLVPHYRQSSWYDPMFHVMSPPDVRNQWDIYCSADVSTNHPSDKDLQRADGYGHIVLSASEKGTRIEDVFERSPIRIMFPRSGHCAMEEAVLINTAGGIAGGDRLEYSVAALPGASIAVTSQAAEKVYRALNEPAHVTTRLKARESSRLAWLPQETIIFNWARFHRMTEIELFSGSQLLALEWLVLGRAAHGEIVVGGSISDSWRVKKDGRLIWADSFRVTDEIFAHLKRKALLSSCNTIATLIYFGPDLDERLEFLREILSSLGCHCAVTLVAGLIVARFAAKESSDLKLALRSFLQQVEPEFGSTPFRVPKMWSC